MNAVLALAVKDLRLLSRDLFALFWILAFPLIFALFFGAIFQGEGDDGRGALRICVVDEDASAAAQALIARLDGNRSLQLERSGDGPDAAIRVRPLAEAREAVQKGRRAAYVRIPAGYGDNPYALFGAAGPDVPELEIGIDPGRQAEGAFLQGVLMEAMFGALQDRFTDRGVLRGDLAAARKEIAANQDLPGTQKLLLTTFLGAVDGFVERFDLGLLEPGGKDGGDGATGGVAAPVRLVDVSRSTGNRPRSSFEITLPQAMVWGLMSVAMSFAITLVRERSSGTLLRLRMAPIGRGQLLAGKGLACFLCCLGTMTALLLFAVLALGVRVGNVPLLLLGMASTAVCFTGLMMLASVLGRTENAVAGSSWGLMMPFAMIGGGMIPLIAMPGWLQQASAFSPFRWAIVAIEGATWRGFTIADMLLPCAVLITVGLALGALGTALLRRIDG